MTLSPGVLAMAALLRKQKDAREHGAEAAELHCAHSPFHLLHPLLQEPFLWQAFALEGAYLKATMAAQSEETQAKSVVFADPEQATGQSAA